MVRYAAGRIEILPGSGIRANNLSLVLERTGCTQLHMSAHVIAHDMSAANGNGICFTASEVPKEGCYKLIDPNKVEEIARMLKEFGEVHGKKYTRKIKEYGELGYLGEHYKNDIIHIIGMQFLS